MPMTDEQSIFFDEWRDCLHAHYLHVLRSADVVTEPTLRGVLLTTGITEHELAAMQVEAEQAAPEIAMDDAAPEAVMEEAVIDEAADDEVDLPVSDAPDDGQLSLF